MWHHITSSCIKTDLKKMPLNILKNNQTIDINHLLNSWHVTSTRLSQASSETSKETVSRLPEFHLASGFSIKCFVIFESAGLFSVNCALAKPSPRQAVLLQSVVQLVLHTGSHSLFLVLKDA